MRCPACRSTAVRHRSERTAQGYRRFRCGDCGKQFNERSAGLLNRAQYPSDVIALVVLWRLRYKLSLRDLAEMFLIRGLVFSYEAVRDWEAKLTPALGENLRRRRKGKVGRSWYVDETYIRVRGGWRYLYRAIDRAGALVDVMLSEHRDLAAAKAFFRSAKAVTGVTPDRVTTDGHDAYPRAIRTELGRHVRHRTSRYLNNRLEQDHRGIKGRCRPMLGLKSTGSARRYLPRPRRAPKLPALQVPHAPTCSRGNAALAAHAQSRDRARHPGDGLSSRQNGRNVVDQQARKLTQPFLDPRMGCTKRGRALRGGIRRRDGSSAVRR
jgi:putative transposase